MRTSRCRLEESRIVIGLPEHKAILLGSHRGGAGPLGKAHGHRLELFKMENKRILTLALAITAFFMLVEVIGGFMSRSLALLADAGHMFTDAAALALSLFAFWLSSRPRTAAKTFGWRRFEIFAAFLNGVSLWAIAGLIGYEAFKRLKSPPEIKSGIMIVIAVLGLLSDIAVGAVLFRSRKRNLNVKGAFLHVLADGLGSIGVLAAALLIRLTGSFVWDPIVSVGVSF